MYITKYLYTDCRILLLLLPVILIVQETYAADAPAAKDAAAGAAGGASAGAADTASGSTSDSENNLATQIQNLIKTIQNYVLLRSQKDINTTIEKHLKKCENVAYSMYDYDNKYEQSVVSESPRRSLKRFLRREKV